MTTAPPLPEAPPGLWFHVGHTWAACVDHEVVVGVDGFAVRLLPCATAVKLPRPGRLLIQGAPRIEVAAGDRKTRIVVPVGGRVLERNEAVRRRPELLREDPYGAGWILRIRPGAWREDRRNLLSGQIAARWLEASAEDLRIRIAGLAGSVIQPARGAASGFLASLPAEPWQELAGELLHSAP